MTQEALKLAFEKVTGIPDAWTNPALMQARNGFIQGWEAKEALAQTQEPVAWPCLIAEADFSQDTVTLTMQCQDYKVSAGKHWLSTTPPQRTWVGLTDEEVSEVFGGDINAEHSGELRFVRAIEAKLKEKNT